MYPGVIEMPLGVIRWLKACPKVLSYFLKLSLILAEWIIVLLIEGAQPGLHIHICVNTKGSQRNCL